MLSGVKRMQADMADIDQGGEGEFFAILLANWFFKIFSWLQLVLSETSEF